MNARDPPSWTETRDRDRRDASGISTDLDAAARIVPIGRRGGQPRLLQRDDIRVVVLDVTQERFLVELFAHPAEKRVAVPRHEALRLACRGIERARARAGVAVGPAVAPRALAGVGRPTDGREEPLHREVPRVARANQKRVFGAIITHYKVLVVLSFLSAFDAHRAVESEFDRLWVQRLAGSAAQSSREAFDDSRCVFCLLTVGTRWRASWTLRSRSRSWRSSRPLRRHTRARARWPPISGRYVSLRASSRSRARFQM